MKFSNFTPEKKSLYIAWANFRNGKSRHFGTKDLESAHPFENYSKNNEVLKGLSNDVKNAKTCLIRDSIKMTSLVRHTR